MSNRLGWLRMSTLQPTNLYCPGELASLVGMAGPIVDVVSRGSTLKFNRLKAVERIADISGRQIVGLDFRNQSCTVARSSVSTMSPRLPSLLMILMRSPSWVMNITLP